MGTALVISWRHGEAPVAPGLGAGPDDPPGRHQVRVADPGREEFDGTED